MKKDIKEAKAHLQRVHELVKRMHSPFEGMSLEDAIRKMRKVRKELWEEKLALRS